MIVAKLYPNYISVYVDVVQKIDGFYDKEKNRTNTMEFYLFYLYEGLWQKYLDNSNVLKEYDNLLHSYSTELNVQDIVSEYSKSMKMKAEAVKGIISDLTKMDLLAISENNELVFTHIFVKNGGGYFGKY